MSKDEKHHDRYVISKIHGLLEDSTISKYTAETIIDILEHNQEMAKTLVDIENRLQDVEESLKDPSTQQGL